MASSKRRLMSTPSRRRQMMIPDGIEAFVSHHQAMGSSPATIRHYEDSLKLLTRCFAENDIPLEVESLTTANMNLLAGWLRETPTRVWRGKTQRSLHGVHGVLKDTKIWIKWLVENDYLAKAPKVPVPKLPQRLFPILTDDELEMVFASSQVTGNSEIALRNRALLAFMLDTAVRLGEVAGLQYQDVNLRTLSARIRGKGNKERMVYFSQGCADALTRWLGVRGEADGSLFWLEIAGIKMLFRRIKLETGLSLFTAHQVRHTALTMLVRDGVDLHTIKRLAGHASVTTTEAYIALAGSDMQEKPNRASPFDKINRTPPPKNRRRLRSA